MADLKDPTLGFGLGDEIIGFFQRLADGFFEKDINPVEKEILGNGMMKRGGNGDADGLHSIEEIGVTKKGLGPIPLGDLPGTGHVNIGHSHEFHALPLGILLRMELAQVPDADHSCSDLLH
jgi:hypothetical protein